MLSKSLVQETKSTMSMLYIKTFFIIRFFSYPKIYVFGFGLKRRFQIQSKTSYCWRQARFYPLKITGTQSRFRINRNGSIDSGNIQFGFSSVEKEKVTGYQCNTGIFQHTVLYIKMVGKG